MIDISGLSHKGLSVLNAGFRSGNLRLDGNVIGIAIVGESDEFGRILSFSIQ